MCSSAHVHSSIGSADHMDTSDHIDSLESDGRLLAEAAAGGDLDAGVPSCPEWKLRELVGHIGSVQRWATRFVADGLTEPGRIDTGEVPEGTAIVDWFGAGHGDLVAALRAADPALECWTFLEAPSPLAFWARRQAHETAIHRVDGELAAGLPVTPFPADFAADGLDELLVGFFGFQRLDGERGGDGIITVRPDDAGVGWLADLNGGDERARGPEPVEGACELRGPASDLYVLLWNRLSLDNTAAGVEGDSSLLDTWRATRAF